MEVYRVISSKKVLVEFDDQQKDQIAAALQVLADNMPGSSQQQESSPVINEVYELSDEDVELVETESAIVEDENDNGSDDEIEEVLGFLTDNNSPIEALVCEVSPPIVNNIDVAKAHTDCQTFEDLSCYISPDCYTNDASYISEISETWSTLSTTENLEKMTAGHSPAQPIYEVIELSDAESIPDSDSHFDNNEDAETTDAVQVIEQPNIKCKSAYDEHINYYCPECDISCGDIASWKLHTENKHNFGSLDAANMQSIVTKHGKLSRQCADCQKKFALTVGFARLMAHRITHLHFPNYVGCRLCHCRYASKVSFIRHLQRSHGDVTKTLGHHDEDALEHIHIVCHICKEQQNSVREWRIHLKKKHVYNVKARSKYVSTGNNLYVCSICASTVRVYSLTCHMLLHEDFKSFSCTHCNEFQSSQLQSAINHVRYKHLRTLNDLLLKCTFCKSSFRTNARRRQHYETVHKVQLKRCNVCNRGFDNSSLLLRHMNHANHHSIKKEQTLSR